MDTELVYIYSYLYCTKLTVCLLNSVPCITPTHTHLLQTFCFLLITSIVWFQVPYVEESIRDRTALLFYMQGSWAFQILGLTVGSCKSQSIGRSCKQSVAMESNTCLQSYYLVSSVTVHNWVRNKYLCISSYIWLYLIMRRKLPKCTIQLWYICHVRWYSVSF